jgi:hypothetical protein
MVVVCIYLYIFFCIILIFLNFLFFTIHVPNTPLIRYDFSSLQWVSVLPS